MSEEKRPNIPEIPHPLMAKKEEFYRRWGSSFWDRGWIVTDAMMMNILQALENLGQQPTIVRKLEDEGGK